MSVAFEAATSWNAATANVQPSALGTMTDRLVLVVAAWKDFSSTATFPGGSGTWTSLGSFADGALAQGNGTGSIKVQAWYSTDMITGGTMPTLTWSVAPNIAGYCTYGFTKSLSFWSTPLAVTAAITNWTTTSQVVSASSTVDVPSGGLVFGFAGLRDDSATFTRPTDGIGGTGVTWNGNYVEQPATHLSTTTNNDGAYDSGYRLVTTGGSSITLTQTATISAAETGSAMWVILNDTNAAAENPQDVFIGGGYYG